MSDSKRFIYALELSGQKYYIGQTTTSERLQAHFKGKGSAWTKLHEVKSILETVDINVADYHHAEIIENRKTIEYMNLYGWENVRGGFWSLCDLEQHRKSLLAHKESLILCGANFVEAIESKVTI